MVADIRLLQGKLIENPEQGSKNISKLIEELALEILSEEELAVAMAPVKPAGSQS